MSCAGAAVVNSLQCRHHGAHHGVHRRYWPGKQGEQMRSIPVDGSWINMSIAQIQPLTHTRGDIERHGDALKAVRLDDTSCIVFLDVSLYRSCIDRYISSDTSDIRCIFGPHLLSTSFQASEWRGYDTSAIHYDTSRYSDTAIQRDTVYRMYHHPSGCTVVHTGKQSSKARQAKSY